MPFAYQDLEAANHAEPTCVVRGCAGLLHQVGLRVPHEHLPLAVGGEVEVKLHDIATLNPEPPC